MWFFKRRARKELSPPKNILDKITDALVEKILARKVKKISDSSWQIFPDNYEGSNFSLDNCKLIYRTYSSVRPRNFEIVGFKNIEFSLSQRIKIEEAFDFVAEQDFLDKIIS